MHPVRYRWLRPGQAGPRYDESQYVDPATTGGTYQYGQVHYVNIGLR
jgi:hypothetical protein